MLYILIDEDKAKHYWNKIQKRGEIMEEKPYDEMYPKEDNTLMWKVYGAAFAFVVLVIIPWAIGAFQLGRWIFF